MDLGLLISKLLEVYSGSHGWVVQVVSIIGTFRLFFKPLIALAQNYVEMTPTVKDDAILSGFLTSNVYKWISFILDLSLSIKIPKPVKEAEIIKFPVSGPKDTA